jgi:hypothetical protein
LYAGFPYPNPPVPSTIPFAVPSGHTGTFAGGATAAGYSIFGGIGGSGLNTRNAYARIGNNTGTLMYLSQSTTATGYAYEEAEFTIDYAVGAGGLGGGAGGPRPYWVYGNFLPGGEAEFGGQVNYWWIPTNYPVNTGVTVTYGTPVLLGTLDYDTQLTGVGSFFATSNGTWTGPGAVAVGSVGILELTGDFYLAGDPVSISVEAAPVPEPVTMLAVGMGIAGLGGYIRRRRLAAK